MNVTEALAQRLREHANPDGGWGYIPGRRSRVEPTSWALLSLTAARPAGDWSPDPALQFLQRARTARGLLADDADAPPNYAFSALAALTAAHIDPRLTTAWLRGPAEAIVGGRGVALLDRSETRQRNSLQAWPWIDGCFSWIEPTAWCLLLMKRLRRDWPDARLSERVEEAERLLFDCSCDGGGWNYGNGAVLDQSLDPFVPTTALALLALQDRPGHPAVRRGLAYLRTHAHDEPSGMALSLALVCLARFGMPTDALEEALVAQYERSRFLNQLHVTAMALYALTAGRAGAEAFRV